MKIKPVRFKSTQENFSKEISGIKCNTLRNKDPRDARYRILKECMAKKEYGRIEIQNTETGAIFSRQITDVTTHRDWYIISWKPDHNSEFNSLYALDDDLMDTVRF